MIVHTNAIAVTIRISVANLIGGGGNTDVFPGSKMPPLSDKIGSAVSLHYKTICGAYVKDCKLHCSS